MNQVGKWRRMPGQCRTGAIVHIETKGIQDYASYRTVRPARSISNMGRPNRQMANNYNTPFDKQQ